MNTNENKLELTSLEIKKTNQNRINKISIKKPVKFKDTIQKKFIITTIDKSVNFHNLNYNKLQKDIIKIMSNVQKFKQDKTIEANCLSLSVRKDYNLSIIKNSIFTTLRYSYKIAFSAFLLNLLKLFF